LRRDKIEPYFVAFLFRLVHKIYFGHMGHDRFERKGLSPIQSGVSHFFGFFLCLSVGQRELLFNGSTGKGGSFS
jgi:hypothetical protein